MIRAARPLHASTLSTASRICPACNVRRTEAEFRHAAGAVMIACVSCRARVPGLRKVERRAK